MNYKDGITNMKQLANKGAGSFHVNSLLITYPGYKKPGDYILKENGIAPKHTDMVKEIYHYTNSNNFMALLFKRFLLSGLRYI